MTNAHFDYASNADEHQWASLKAQLSRAEDDKLRALNQQKADYALKADGEKARFDLLPADALAEVAHVLAFGARKYSEWNWANGFHWSRLIGAALRHIFAFAHGENLDPETGRSHIAHAMCCLLFLLSHQLQKVGKDDRRNSHATTLVPSSGPGDDTDALRDRGF